VPRLRLRRREAVTYMQIVCIIAAVGSLIIGIGPTRIKA
jgi:hypothetical protein